MVGNVFEMTLSDWRASYDHYDYFAQTVVNATGYKVAKGLAYLNLTGGFGKDLIEVLYIINKKSTQDAHYRVHHIQVVTI